MSAKSCFNISKSIQVAQARIALTALLVCRGRWPHCLCPIQAFVKGLRPLSLSKLSPNTRTIPAALTRGLVFEQWTLLYEGTG